MYKFIIFFSLLIYYIYIFIFWFYTNLHLSLSIYTLYVKCIYVKMFVHKKAHTWGQRDWDTHIFVHSMRRSSLLCNWWKILLYYTTIATFVVDGRISETIFFKWFAVYFLSHSTLPFSCWFFFNYLFFSLSFRCYEVGGYKI